MKTLEKIVTGPGDDYITGYLLTKITWCWPKGNITN